VASAIHFYRLKSLTKTAGESKIITTSLSIRGINRFFYPPKMGFGMLKKKKEE
jgi:hypothetical protein